MNEKLTRKVIQIAIGQREDDDNEPCAGSRLFALCDDGTIWYNDMGSSSKNVWPWWALPTVPQGPREDIGEPFEREGEEK